MKLYSLRIICEIQQASKIVLKYSQPLDKNLRKIPAIKIFDSHSHTAFHTFRQLLHFSLMIVTDWLSTVAVCSTSYWGKLSFYGGSGYTAEISSDAQTQLESRGWIDKRFLL